MGNYNTKNTKNTANTKKSFSDSELVRKYKILNEELNQENNNLLIENKQLEEALVKTKKDLSAVLDNETKDEFKEMYTETLKRYNQVIKDLRDLRIQKDLQLTSYRDKIILHEQHLKDLYHAIESLDVDKLTDSIFKENNSWMVFDDREKECYKLGINSTLKKISEHIYT